VRIGIERQISPWRDLLALFALVRMFRGDRFDIVHSLTSKAGLLAMAAAYDDRGAVVGGGSHGPRGATSELTGIAVLPRARRRGVGAAITAALVADARSRGVRTVFLSAQDDAVARVYERVGFVRVGTACIAERS